MAELESDRADGTLAATVTEAETKYEAVEGDIGLFREIRSDGSSRLGVVIDGKFEPQYPNRNYSSKRPIHEFCASIKQVLTESPAAKTLVEASALLPFARNNSDCEVT